MIIIAIIVLFLSICIYTNALVMKTSREFELYNVKITNWTSFRIVLYVLKSNLEVKRVLDSSFDRESISLVEAIFKYDYSLAILPILVNDKADGTNFLVVDEVIMGKPLMDLIRSEEFKLEYISHLV